MNILQEAVKATIITEAEADLINQAEQARQHAISVDDFTPEQLICASKMSPV
jgi:hypothetical protein